MFSPGRGFSLTCFFARRYSSDAMNTLNTAHAQFILALDQQHNSGERGALNPIDSYSQGNRCAENFSWLLS